jgi:hypothetical protein
MSNEAKKRWRINNIEKVKEQARQSYHRNKNIKVGERLAKDCRNPLRQCKNCGSIGDSYEIKKPYGLIYSALCRVCTLKRAKSRTYTECQKCGNEKDESYVRYCYECSNRLYFEKTRITPYEDLVEIKKWIRKCEIRGWMTDLMGINELITMYDKIKRNNEEFDSFGSGKQLDRMFKRVLKAYEVIKDLTDEQLKVARFDKVQLIITNQKEVDRLTKTDEDLNFFFKTMNEFEFEGKTYSLVDEYKDCLMKVSKVSCVRCRKIIQQLRRELVILRGNTGIKSKYGKK